MIDTRGNPVRLQRGQTVAHYHLLEQLGEGGMGVVWKAEDTTLGRAVAIKVLPEALAADPERLARFEREARMLAALDHANIAAIYGLEEADGRKLLVMQLAEGETLAKRIARGPIPLDQALRIALQIAKALESAHDKGIVHRDLKPANVMVSPDGQVKILDFGLAKALAPEPQGPRAVSLSISPTLTAQMTTAGVLLGTAAYMSPEQARGEEADERADIWAFGAVLTEMLTGQKVFEGKTTADTLAAVLRAQPDWDALDLELPRGIRRLLRRCLERDLHHRLHDIADGRIEIEDVLAASGTEEEAGFPEPTGTRPSRHRWLPWTVTGVMAALAALSMLVGRPTRQTPTPLRKLEITEIENVGFIRSFVPGSAISPDGGSVAYVSEGKLWLRRLDELEGRAIPGTTWESKPIWSPDSRWLAYPSGQRLWKVPVGGGEPKAVADLPTNVGPFGGGWREDDRIVFTTGYSGLLSVSAQGGDVTTLLAPDPETEADFHEASLLPGDKGAIFAIHLKGRQEGPLGLWDGRSRKILLEIEGQSFAGPVYSPSGHILYRRSPSGHGIWAVPFSIDDLEISGEPFLLVPEGESPSVAGDGTLVYLQGVQEEERELVWVDRGGRVLETAGVPQQGLLHPAVSPDGTRAAVTASEGTTVDLFVHDLSLRTKNRLTASADRAHRPSWSPDGKRLLFHIVANEPQLVMVDAEGRDEPVDLGPGGRPTWSPDGRYIVYELFGARGLWYRELHDEGPIGEPIFILDAPSDESHPVLSPDGRFLAYDSDESGTLEVYLTRFPGAEGRWQVSTGGGINPRWSAAGNELFFVDAEGRMFSARVRGETSPRVEAPVMLFDARPYGLAEGGDFGIDPDGQRFLLTRSTGEARQRPSLLLIQNWAAEYQGN